MNWKLRVSRHYATLPRSVLAISRTVVFLTFRRISSSGSLPALGMKPSLLAASCAVNGDGGFSPLACGTIRHDHDPCPNASGFRERRASSVRVSAGDGDP